MRYTYCANTNMIIHDDSQSGGRLLSQTQPIPKYCYARSYRKISPTRSSLIAAILWRHGTAGMCPDFSETYEYVSTRPHPPSPSFKTSPVRVFFSSTIGETCLGRSLVLWPPLEFHLGASLAQLLGILIVWNV